MKGSESLEGPCFSFQEDAFIQSSAEMHFADCHHVAKDQEDEEDADGGAIYVGSNLTVTGHLSIHNCSAEYGGSLALSVQLFLLIVDGEWVSFFQFVLRWLCSDRSSRFWSLLMTCCDNVNSLGFVNLMTWDRA